MTSWVKSSTKLVKAIYSTYESEDDIINLNITRNTTSYPDSDITVILKKINNDVIVETITIDNSFTPYILYINNSSYQIGNQNEYIQIFTNRTVIIPELKIPKNIIHTWNDKNINTELSYPIRVIKALNPEYNYILCDENDRKEFIKNNYDINIYDAYNKLKPGAFRADLWRYCYLYKYGGIYCDIKMVFRKSFNSFIKSRTELILGKAMYNDGVNNGFMACFSNEPLMKLAIDTSVDRIENNYYGVSSLDITGPVMLEYCFNKLYGVSSSQYIENPNNKILMVRYNDINNYNCFLYNNNLIAHTYFSTYRKHRATPYVVFWNERNVYNC